MVVCQFICRLLLLVFVLGVSRWDFLGVRSLCWKFIGWLDWFGISLGHFEVLAFCYLMLGLEFVLVMMIEESLLLNVGNKSISVAGANV